MKIKVNAWYYENLKAPNEIAFPSLIDEKEFPEMIKAVREVELIKRKTLDL